LIEVVAVPPIFALAGRIDQQAPHMLDLNWAPMVGALVIHYDTWMQIPAAMRGELLAAAKEACEDIQSRSRQESDEAVTAMQKRGLQVHAVTPEMWAIWEAEAEANLLPRIRGTMVPAETYDQVQQIVEAFRSREAPGSE
jgi:TRAP-type C4-dicarboxylate transport system substrate-binding protein